MKHVIVIETSDPPDGKPFPRWLQQLILGKIENVVEERHGLCFTQSRFNVSSATVAIHEMYSLPPWDPETGTCGPSR
jgi:hypothetical protein